MSPPRNQARTIPARSRRTPRSTPEEEVDPAGATGLDIADDVLDLRDAPVAGGCQTSRNYSRCRRAPTATPRIEPGQRT